MIFQSSLAIPGGVTASLEEEKATPQFYYTHNPALLGKYCSYSCPHKNKQQNT